MAMSPSSEQSSGEHTPEFAYLPPPRDDNYYKEEGLGEKLLRKTKENPFVPVGLIATTVALSYGMWQMKTGDKRMSQIMMRFRIGAQAFTIGAVLLGVLYSAKQKKQ